MSHFEVRSDGIKVKDSSTVLCVRRRPNGVLPLTLEDCGGARGPVATTLKAVFGSEGVISFSGGWEVLLGQNEVVNWLKSSPEKLVTMRYAGEWKLAGGNVDPHEAIDEAASRELHEEFLAPLGVALSSRPVLRPFVTKQTRPVRSQSNLMHCFVALEEENEWLRDLDVDRINNGLADRRTRFSQLAQDEDGIPSPAFWALPREEREQVTPEVRQVAWVTLRDAVRLCLQSMTPGLWANDFQERAFAKYGRKTRDPMFITGACLMELEGFPHVASLIGHCDSVDLAQLTREEQWLFHGMSAEAMEKAFKERVSKNAHKINPSFKAGETIARLRRERALQFGGSARL